MREIRSTYFHAHIYFTAATRERAVAFRDKLLAAFPRDLLQVYRLFDQPIGPHPVGMFEADFHAPAFDRVVDYLRAERDGLDILVHQNTEDEVWNHSEGALWLGDVQPLDFDRLRAFMAGKIPAVGPIVQTPEPT